MPSPAAARWANTARRLPARRPRAWVADMGRSLDFYLDVGCEVRSAADRWVLMCCSSVSIVLIQAGEHALVSRPRRLARWPAIGSPLIPS